MISILTFNLLLLLNQQVDILRLIITNSKLIMIDDFKTNLLNPSAKSMGTKWQEERLKPMKTAKEGQNLSTQKQLCKALESGSMYSMLDCK